MKSFVFVVALALCGREANAFSLSMKSSEEVSTISRRSLFSTIGATATAAVIGASNGTPANAAPQIFTTPSGIKYAVLKEPKDSKKAPYPQKGDIVAIDYTGYLSNGQIFDSTHSESSSNSLLFKLGTPAVIEGLNEMVAEMKVGQKVQAIIPPSLAFGDKGLCLDDGECLIKPGATLVYDVFLKKSSIPPP